MTDSSPKIGIALGSGASRGWSHIGVLKALSDEGIKPDVVCGTSVGAMIGAAWLAGNLQRLEEWVLDATHLDVFKFFEIRLKKTGFVDEDRFRQFIHNYVVDRDANIEDLPTPFACVSTDVNTGREFWFTEGNVLEATCASMSLPGLFATVNHADKWLVDGGLVNPVPVSVCRALGAEFVIAVNLNSDILGKRERERVNEEPDDGDGVLGRFKKSAREYSEAVFATNRNGAPGMFDVVSNSINIFQDRITRSRLAGDPADVLISPRLAHIGLLDFHRAAEAIKEGEERTLRVIEDIRRATAGSR